MDIDYLIYQLRTFKVFLRYMKMVVFVHNILCNEFITIEGIEERIKV
jgi:hypothetical protein